MKTVAYQDILYRAAELAGRTRDNIPLSEAVMIRGFVAVDLADVWNKHEWPELRPDPPNVTTIVNQQFSKNESTPLTEMGDILAVWTANPLISTRAREVGFVEGDGVVKLDEPIASVWVEYMLPAPDLMAVADNLLAAYLIPRRFSNYLALRAAGHLLNSDIEASGNSRLQLAEGALATELNRLVPPTWRNVRLRRGYARPRPVTPLALP
jgi:hypothetical protein